MDIFASIFDAPDPVTPSVSQAGPSDWGDNPGLRWRATWNKSYDDEVIGVLVTPYPVIKDTPQGAWIDPYAYWHGEWNLSASTLHRWVSNNGGQAWAKPTRKAAIDSLIYRHRRWSSRILNDIIYFRDVTNVLGALFPDEATHVAHSLSALEFTAKTGKR